MSTNMTPNEFRAFLRDLQEDAYLWPNDYFAWEKPDKTLLMVGVCSTQFDQLLIHEAVKSEHDTAPEYVTRCYSIAPNVTHLTNGKRFDPVEALVDKVSDCRYLGSWHDHDVLIDSPTSYSKVLACGRWDLAKKHILHADKKPSLNQQISQAQGKVSAQAPQKDVSELSHSGLKNGNDFARRD